MKQLTKNKIFSIIIVFLMSFMIILSGVCPTYVRADDSVVKFDESNVLDDLEDMTLDGKKFSLEEYNFDTKKDTQILSFVEYCYSFYEEKQDDFGFYVYIYNPKGLKFKTDSSLNTIQFATTKDSDSAYTKYTLTYLNKSEKADYEGLFYKFKVNLTEEQKTAILNGVNSSSRVYKVSGFELVTQGDLNATDYEVSLTYKYSGYAKGCGPNENAESTLKFTSEGLETLSLDVHATTYRPDGTNGKNDYTQDSLHSVYFAVPNKVIEQYGEMVAVHATWLNAVLKPALVTGNQDAYNAIYNFIGQNIGQHNEDLNYMYLGAHSSFSGSMGMNLTSHECGYYYNGVSDWSGHMVGLGSGTEINTLYMLFNSGTGTDSADDYIITSEDIKEKLIESANKFGGNLVNGKFSECIFESVDEEFTEVNIRADETYSLDSELQVLGSSWWDKLWGITHTVSSTFDGIQAIYPIKESDTKGSIVEVSNRLFVSQSDVEDLKTYYNANKENSTVYLFRYQVSDYVSQEATLFEEGSSLGFEVWNEVDTNAYFFQETINLDFDIIDVTFSTGEVETVIPVVSNPIDVVPDGTPPVYTESDEGFDFFKLIVGLLLLILLLYFLSATGALPLIGNVLVWILTAPFKFIKWLIDKFRGD
ncbi:MAG: hypothetical protein IJW43_00010 [Clostridia bacterium]|nr:hypothetical protein [Clostridia bacterium]